MVTYSLDGRIILADVVASEKLATKPVRMKGDHVTGLGGTAF